MKTKKEGQKIALISPRHKSGFGYRLGYGPDEQQFVTPSYQHFFDSQDPTICFDDSWNSSVILDLQLGKETHYFPDLNCIFMRYQNYILGETWHESGLICTLDLRQPYKGCTKSKIGYSDDPKFSSNFTLMNPDESIYSFHEKSCVLLPRGILSVKESDPTRVTNSNFYAKIYGGNYLCCGRWSNDLLRYFPEKKRKKYSLDYSIYGEANYQNFGGNQNMIFGYNSQFYF